MRYFTPKKEKGFTLTETIVVAIMVGISAAIAAPSMVNSWRRVKAKEALELLSSALRDAQANANRMSTTCTVTINSLTPGYEIIGNPTGCLAQRDVIREDFLVINNTGTANVSFTFTGTTNTPRTFVIYPDNNTTVGKCLVVSNGLGMIRTGEYFGDASGAIDPNDCKNVKNDKYIP